MKDKEEETQVSALIYMMGNKVEDVLRSFGLNDEDKKYKVDMKRTLSRSEMSFTSAQSLTYRNEDGEPVDDFVTSLYSWLSIATLGALHDKMIRDRFVVGLRDANLSEKLQLDSELTLEKAIWQASLKVLNNSRLL